MDIEERRKQPNVDGQCKYYLGNGWCCVPYACATRGKLPCKPMYDVLETCTIKKAEPLFKRDE